MANAMAPASTSYFVLPNLLKITSRAFELRQNPLQPEADKRAIEWFRRFGVYDDSETQTSRFLSKGRFDLLGGLGFPDADMHRLETCVMWLMWAFCLDDSTDEDWQREPGAVQVEHRKTDAILYDSDAPQPTHPRAGMLWEPPTPLNFSILNRVRATATPNSYERYVNAYLEWTQAQVEQSRNRSLDYLPTVEEFILLRRSTYGGNFCGAMVEWAGDFQIPPHAFEHPALTSMTNALIDLMAWTNDLCSLQKEYNDGDLHNLVIIVRHYENCTLQDAVDKVVEMTDRRVQEYMDMKAKIPSFDEGVDREVARYLRAYEDYVQGSIGWCYLCPRYFGGFEAPIEKDSLTIGLDMH
ncbi:terpenoid synthase [Marasmius fiardii PR-910]|nr:terpenoid synthase [Marasmius fiardii PR-910]